MELAKKCVGDERCVAKGSTPFVKHNSHLSQIRTGAALVHFDVPLGGGLGGVQTGGGRGRLLEHKQMFKSLPLR